MVPKIIHQVWIGPKKLPVEWTSTWPAKNPNFEYLLWREKDVSDFELKNKDKYDYYIGTGCYNGACNIVRVEILEKYGGVYLDADSVCLESIEEAPFMKKDFFAVKEYEGRVANGIIGSIPGHPILKEYIKKLSQVTKMEPSCHATGGRLLTSCIDQWGEDKKVEILPTCSFLPKDHWGRRAPVEEKIYAKQFWGTTNNLYK